MGRGTSDEQFDLAVVGAGILGLATALAGARRGMRVVVIDRDDQARGASVRNFGFVTVSGQQAGRMWGRALRTREVWSELATAAAIPIIHRGVWMLARRPESVAVLEAFMATDMAEGCRLLTPSEARRRCPQLRSPALAAVMESRVELRVDSRQAIPRLARWLGQTHGVRFLRSTVVQGIDLPWVRTSGERLRTERVAVCPGDDYAGLYQERLAGYGLGRCQLQMLRLADPGFKLPATLMSDLGMVRNAGYADLPPAGALRSRLQAEQPLHLQHGVHLIAVQNADGTLVVGDSHHYTPAPDGIAQPQIEALILDEFREALGVEPPEVLERWIGTYAFATDRTVLLDAPEPGVRLAIVTCGSGASTAFAIGEELVDSFF